VAAAPAPEFLRFKLGYGRTLRWAALGALLLLAVAWWLLPSYEPEPYRLRQEHLTLLDPLIEAPPVPDVPEPRTRIPQLRTIEPAPAEEADVPTIPDLWELRAGPTDWIDVPPPGDVFVVKMELPQLLHRARADYPEIARLSGLQGRVVIHALVGVEGRVTETRVFQGVHPVLDRAAQTAALKCRFTPGTQRERPVPVWVALPFEFRLR
jgi:TonB family protein